MTAFGLPVGGINKKIHDTFLAVGVDPSLCDTRSSRAELLPEAPTDGRRMTSSLSY